MTIASGLLILVAAVFTQNILLTSFIGMCAFLGCSRQYDTSVGMGVAIVFVTTCTVAIDYLLYHHVLVPLGIEYLSLIVYIVVIAAFVQFVEMFVERFSPKLYHALGIFLPLIATNTVVLAASLFMVIRNYTFVQSVLYGFGASLGWMLAILLLAGIRKKMGYSRVPQHLQGAAISLVVASVMAMAFMGFAGMAAE